MSLDENWELYKTFYQVSKYSSFSKAAEELYITQPSISRAMSALEKNLNTRLFYRSSTGTKLTPDGIELYNYVDKSYNLLLSGERNLKESKNLEHGEVTIGVQSHIGEFFLFPFVEKFRKEYPNIKINIVSRNTDEMLNFLENNAIDFIIDTSPINSVYNNLEIVPLFDLKNTFISKKNISNNPISLKDLGKYNLVLPVKRSTPRKELDAICKKRGIELEPFMTIETTEMLVNAVKKEMGIGYTIKQAVYKELKNEELFEVKIKEELPTLELNLVYISDYLTHIPEKFMKIIRQNYKEYMN